MTIGELARKLGLEDLTPGLAGGADEAVTAGYVSDLLSDVLANGPAGGVLVTVQVHLNVVAVAVHAGLRGIVFAMGRVPDETVRRKAVEEGIRLYGTRETAFEVVGRLHAAGVPGGRA